MNITVKELIEQLSKYRDDAIVTVSVDNEERPVIEHEVFGCFKPSDDEEWWRNTKIDRWVCSLKT